VLFVELRLSLIGWAFVLGLIGAIVAEPMTLALKKFIATRPGAAPSPGTEHLAPEPSG
jgi:predicted PurR-regulated permease PerM